MTGYCDHQRCVVDGRAYLDWHCCIFGTGRGCRTVSLGHHRLARPMFDTGGRGIVFFLYFGFWLVAWWMEYPLSFDIYLAYLVGRQERSPTQTGTASTPTAFIPRGHSSIYWDSFAFHLTLMGTWLGKFISSFSPDLHNEMTSHRSSRPNGRHQGSRGPLPRKGTSQLQLRPSPPRPRSAGTHPTA